MIIDPIIPGDDMLLSFQKKSISQAIQEIKESLICQENNTLCRQFRRRIQELTLNLMSLISQRHPSFSLIAVM